MSDHGRRSARGRDWRGAELLGVILIGIGVVYLLGNLHIVRIAWSAMWPVAIIAVGAFVLVGALRPSSNAASSARVARETAARLELDLSAGAGRFELTGGASPDALVEVASSNDDIATRTDRSGDLARVRLRQDVAWWPNLWRAVAGWSVKVASDVPTVFTMNAGAGDFSVDLSTIVVAGARMQIGAAQARIVLPRPRGTVEMRVTGGASQLTFVAPPGVEYRLEMSGGLTSVDGRTESPGYATATDRVVIRFSGGAASVRIG